MKKAIYLLAATALMASCNQDVLVEKPQLQPEVNHHIGFETFVEKATRSASNNSTNLQDFYPSFVICGWKTVGEETTGVFENVAVNYYDVESKAEDGFIPGEEWGDVSNGWYYNEIRYWDKMASKYQYSAYVPAYAFDEVSCQEDGTITIGTEETPVTVDNTNLMETPAENLAYVGFIKDYMTAQATAEPSTDAADMSTSVSLNFQHLLAKLNIRIKLDTSISTSQEVKVNTIEVHNLSDQAYYINAAEGVSGWTSTTASDTYIPTANAGYSLNGVDNVDGYYVMEQLIIPQTIKSAAAAVPSLTEYDEACVYVEYTIGTEVFKNFTPLANIFSTAANYNLEGGKQYTLNITVGPKPIEFTAVVAEWKDGNDQDLPLD